MKTTALVIEIEPNEWQSKDGTKHNDSVLTMLDRTPGAALKDTFDFQLRDTDPKTLEPLRDTKVEISVKEIEIFRGRLRFGGELLNGSSPTPTKPSGGK